jgi:hypothetical protein
MHRIIPVPVDSPAASGGLLEAIRIAKHARAAGI